MELEDLIAYIKGDDTLKVEIEAWAEKDRANADELKKLSLAEYAMRLKEERAIMMPPVPWAA